LVPTVEYLPECEAEELSARLEETLLLLVLVLGRFLLLLQELGTLRRKL
jgi:hypothetical protein